MSKQITLEQLIERYNRQLRYIEFLRAQVLDLGGDPNQYLPHAPAPEEASLTPSEESNEQTVHSD